jgi:hypothetical protein
MTADRAEWIAAKAEGDIAEVAIALWFRGRGWEPYRTVGETAFDLLLQTSVEVKHDRKAGRSGRVAIETHYHGRPSGLLTSTAGYWAIVVDETAFIVKTDALLRFVQSNEFTELRGGDNQASTLRLIPVERLREVLGFQVVNLGEPQE